MDRDTCPRCGGKCVKTYLGYLVMEGRYGPTLPIRCIEGAYDTAFWRGKKAIRVKHQYNVISHRCEQCGHLDLFADEPVDAAPDDDKDATRFDHRDDAPVAGETGTAPRLRQQAIKAARINADAAAVEAHIETLRLRRWLVFALAILAVTLFFAYLFYTIRTPTPPPIPSAWPPTPSNDEAPPRLLPH